MLVVIRVVESDEAIALVNDNPYGNGTAYFYVLGDAARTFQRAVTPHHRHQRADPRAVGHPFGCRSTGCSAKSHIYGPESVRFYTCGKLPSFAQQPRPSFPGLAAPCPTDG